MKVLLFSLLVLCLSGTTRGAPPPIDDQSDLAIARRATARFHRVEQAEAEGYINLHFCEEGEGCHWLKPALLDDQFDPSQPEILLYVPDGDDWRLVAVEYAVPLSLSPGVAPEGFPGDADHWREDSEGVGLWELTAWIWLHNPNGMFEQHNPRIADPSSSASIRGQNLDQQLKAVLASNGFTGRVESTLEQRLGRKVDNQLADLGRLLFFDTVGGLNNDNNCSGCHSPTNGFGDTQSIAIGIDNNGVVGPDRAGPRNQRRTPMVVNTAFFPNLMWNSRFASLSNDPFNNSAGFQFPSPEGLTLSYQPHLLVAQAFIPPTERVEVAGFVFPGDNFDIRNEVLRRINNVSEYRKLFGRLFPSVRDGGPVSFDMFGRAIAEFEFSLVFADAPIDQFARGQSNALTADQKQGALLFFGRARCVQCHQVSGASNEMFSDFSQHVIGVPQIAPSTGNVVFDGPSQNEDFGLEQVTGNPADRYKFRTSPIRNVALQPAFFHNGAFTRLEDAIRHHLDVFTSARNYTPEAAGIDADLRAPMGPIEPVLARIDPILASPVELSDEEFQQLVDFVRNGLLDKRAKPERLKKLIPSRVPSGFPVLKFQ
ncbi:MAG TPA: cytochrome c peroxidase [Pyrinomonadaceae bacterium]|nr:cytochrome c peroxidase [Pyrinomonadaceae bacterium]